MIGNTRGREREDIRIVIDNKTLPQKKPEENRLIFLIHIHLLFFLYTTGVRPQPSKFLFFQGFRTYNFKSLKRGIHRTSCVS